METKCSHVQVPVFIDDGGELPSYMTAGAAGADMRASEKAVVPPFGFVAVETGVHVEIPEFFEGQIRSRSGLAAKHGVFVLNAPGTIDSDYRGSIKVILGNMGKEAYVVERGDRIAQLVVAPVVRADFAVRGSRGELSPTVRDEGALGHTGRK